MNIYKDSLFFFNGSLGDEVVGQNLGIGVSNESI